ncbi:glycoside hydrolase family 18, catalytic domain-containing protein [Artemisia annua]|uniref:Glycoside hydrolase family 18, catalytic domain-containing protein n=1 Tax=Artemisia annua TaxID=35608 RepID=A0A2U1PHD7_ARTAN|nr:glycoside hydrolase family 18, catalytic domain-containing protein [Artemisia annua]
MTVGLFVYLKDLINKEVLTIGIRAYGSIDSKETEDLRLFVRSIEKNRSTILVAAVRKNETEGNNYFGLRKLRLFKSSWLIGTRVLFLEDTVGKPLVNQGTAVKEEDGSSSLLFSNVDEKTKEHKCEHCGHVNSSQERTERGRGKNWKPWKKRDGDQDKSQIRCYKCKELGHYKSECPKWEKEHEANLIQEDDEPTLL